MATMTERVLRTEQRVKSVQETQARHIPAGHYQQATAKLVELRRDYRRLEAKQRFAVDVMGSDVDVKTSQIENLIGDFLGGHFSSFAQRNLASAQAINGMANQTQALIQLMAQLEAALDQKVTGLRHEVGKRLDDALAQAKLLKKLNKADLEAEVLKVKTQFDFLMRRYGGDRWIAETPAEWQGVLKSVAEVSAVLSLEAQLGLSTAAAGFMRRVASGGAQAPTLADLTPDILAEVRKLPAVASNVKLVRG